MKVFTSRFLFVLLIALFLIGQTSITLADDTDIVINEIMYNPSTAQGSDDYYEYVELVNIGITPVDVNGWIINGDIIGPYNSGSTTVIIAGGYALVTDGTSSASLDGGIHLAVDDDSIGNGLINSSGTITLNNGTIDIDVVVYSSGDGANGNGSSLECMNPILDNATTSNGNWSESTPSGDYGSPGIENSNYTGPALPPVPELATIILLAIGLAVFGYYFIHKRKMRSKHGT